MNSNEYKHYSLMDTETLEHKVRKYNHKLNQKINMVGGKKKVKKGGKKEEAEKKEVKKPQKEVKKQKETKNKKDMGDKHILKVECVEVYQEKEDLKYSSRTCKTPPINIRLTHEENKLSYIIKIILNYVNKILKTRDVTSVEYTVDKKKKVDGDKLGDTMINIKDTDFIKEIKIVMK